MIEVRGRQYQQLVEALVHAYPDANSFARMLEFRLEKRLATIAALPNPMTQVAFEVIGVANAGGWTGQLIAAAREAQPSNPKLLKLAEDFGLTAATAEFERKVRDDLSYLDITQWRERLGALETQVCRVETPRTMGTGFLLGPDVLITNHHVMEDVIKAPDLASEVVLRFDYKRLADGTTLNKGTEFRLATDWLLDDSPYSGVDKLADPGAEVPHEDELDYALLRVEGEPGNQPAGAKAEPGAPARGWIKAAAPPSSFAENAPLFILQHPEGKPLKLALDTKSVLQTNGNGTRVRYRTNTEKGSSGSPVFDDHWNLVALHHSGDRNIVPTYNQGIPFAAILRLLEKRGKKGLLDRPTD